MKSPTQRAKIILDLCAYELRPLSVGDLMTLEAAIKSEIEAAERVVMRELNRGKIPDHMENDLQRIVDGHQMNLLRIRKREKK